MDREHDRAEAKSNELANFHEGAQDMRRMQAVYRAQKFQYINNQALRTRELEATAIRHEKTIEDLREKDEIAQLLIKAQEDKDAALEIKEQSRRNSDFRRNESELETL